MEEWKSGRVEGDCLERDLRDWRYREGRMEGGKGGRGDWRIGAEDAEGRGNFG